MKRKHRGNPRILEGIVRSDKMDKTIVVEVLRRYKHSMYKKFVNMRKRYKAHDENNDCRLGDRVRIVECRPLSRHKHWRLRKILERAIQL